MSDGGRSNSSRAGWLALTSAPSASMTSWGFGVPSVASSRTRSCRATRLEASRLPDCASNTMRSRKRELRHLREDPLLRLHRAEERRVGQEHLRAAEKQIAVVIQGVVETRQDLALRLGREIDERVAADQQVQARDGRVLRQVVPAEDHRPAKRGMQEEPLALRFEIPLGDVFADRRDVFGRIARTRLGQGLLVDVGRVDLDPVEKRLLAERLAEQDGRRACLLSGRCPSAPDADVARLGGDPRNDVL